MTPATRQVEVVVAEIGRPATFESSAPGVERMPGLTKMMYDMTTNVVSTASNSVRPSEPIARKRKNRSSVASQPPPAGMLAGLAVVLTSALPPLNTPTPGGPRAAGPPQLPRAGAHGSQTTQATASPYVHYTS